MTAFFVFARSEITDEQKSREYARLVVPQIREFGGELLVARGAVGVLEGEWNPHSVTILSFDDLEALQTWYESPEYAPLKQMRLESNAGDVITVDGG